MAMVSFVFPHNVVVSELESRTVSSIPAKGDKGDTGATGPQGRSVQSVSVVYGTYRYSTIQKIDDTWFIPSYNYDSYNEAAQAASASGGRYIWVMIRFLDANGNVIGPTSRPNLLEWCLGYVDSVD